jgi:Leucine-rich repeat (LRR) protein
VADGIRDHPSREDLQAYSQGLLGPEAASAVEEHLGDCSSCCELVEKTPNDSFVCALRAADSTTPDVERGVEADVPPGAAAEVPHDLMDHPKYRVLGLVGQGGMGAVYRAVHRRMDRLVALKVVHPRLMRKPAAVQRFHQEVRAAARLHHPNIVTAHDADQAGGVHFLVMEYVEGISLADLVRRRGPLPVRQAAEFIRQAALGLQHAHERKMVHRDVKPQNLMLQRAAESSSCVVKILDFGLARLPLEADRPVAAGGSAGPLTGVGAVMGTADYIAPEQAADPRAADIRSDIYSLGCTLFHLLTGRPPFPEGGVSEKLARHARSPLPEVRALRPDVPAGLSAVLARMTAKDPADRYATPAEVAGALTAFSTGGSRPLLARRRWLWLAATGVVLAAGLLAGALAKFAPAFSGAGGGDRREHTPAERTKQGPDAARAIERPAPSAREKDGRQAAEREQKAIEAVERLGGWVRRDFGKRVVSVVLAGSKATDADLEHVAAFENLRVLDASRTSITDAGLRRLTGLKQLTSLILAFTRLSDAGMKHVGKLKQLELQFARVGDDGVKDLAGLDRLGRLSLYRTKVTDLGMPSVGRLKKLSFLSLDETAVTDEGLKSLTGLDELVSLGLFAARGVGDEGMKSVARLRRLTTLDLTGTRVTDTGLRELGGCVQLASLRVGGLNVTNRGVKALAKLTALRLLDLSNTGVSDEGMKEVALKRNMTDLTLSGAKKLTDVGVKELAGLPALRTLGLARTEVTDAGLEALAGCKSLTFLGLMGAGRITAGGVEKLRKSLPKLKIQAPPNLPPAPVAPKSDKEAEEKALEAIKALGGYVRWEDGDPVKPVAEVQLFSARVTDASLALLKAFPRLRKLSVTNAAITDEGVATLKGMTRLEELNLGGCREVTDKGVSHLAALTGLKALDLSYTKITNQGAAHLAGLRNLRKLSLSTTIADDGAMPHLEGLAELRELNLFNVGHFLSGKRVTDAGLARLKGLTKLQVLLIPNSGVTGKGLEHLKAMTDLRQLNLFCTPVDDAGLLHLKGMSNLERLTLSGTKFTDKGLAAIAGLRRLQDLAIDFSGLTGEGLVHVKDLTELRRLDLSQTAVNDAGLAHLAGLTRLSNLNLTSTKVTDAGLAHLKANKDLFMLWLSGSGITDAGLDHLKGLKRLGVVYLFGTRVTQAGVDKLKEARPRVRVDRK